ncbi:hypothetical protein ACFSTI_20645 [Rhizorhabdus histidinilytica]
MSEIWRPMLRWAFAIRAVDRSTSFAAFIERAAARSKLSADLLTLASCEPVFAIRSTTTLSAVTDMGATLWPPRCPDYRRQ